MLLKELEQARGSLVTHRDDQSGGDDDGDVSDAQSVISQKLVTFRLVPAVAIRQLQVVVFQGLMTHRP